MVPNQYYSGMIVKILCTCASSNASYEVHLYSNKIVWFTVSVKLIILNYFSQLIHSSAAAVSIRVHACVLSPLIFIFILLRSPEAIMQ